MSLPLTKRNCEFVMTQSPVKAGLPSSPASAVLNHPPGEDLSLIEWQTVVVHNQIIAVALWWRAIRDPSFPEMTPLPSKEELEERELDDEIQFGDEPRSLGRQSRASVPASSRGA